jgi:hypothetical protein
MSQFRQNIARRVQNNPFPTELWLHILDFVVGDSIGTQQHCNYTNFPETILHLRAPWIYPPPIETIWLRNLRLVCQTFNSLLRQSPYYIMKDINKPIPSGTRALYIYPIWPTQELFQRLLNEPSKSHRIVSLSVPGPESGLTTTPPLMFDFLCSNANLLPNLQSLTLSLCFYPAKDPGTPKPWSRLNEAFPNLTSLVLRGSVRWTLEVQPVSFQKLEILDLGDMSLPDPTISFPTLRHAVLGDLSFNPVKTLTRSGRLESLLFRDASAGAEFDWDLVPKLRLLGIPSSVVEVFPPTPRAHPLHRLHIFVGIIPRDDGNIRRNRKEKELQLMKQAVERFPNVSQITLAFQTHSNHLESDIIGDFDEEELRRVGLVVNYTSREDHIVLDRVPLTTPRMPFLNHVTSCEFEAV